MKNALIDAYHSDESNLRAVSKRLPMANRIAQSRKAEAEKSILKMVVIKLNGPCGVDVADDASEAVVSLVPLAASNASCSTTCCNEAIRQVARGLR